MPRKNSARRACAFSLAAATALALPVGVAVRAGAATTTPTITASASSYILSASHNPTVTLKAHVVDPSGAKYVQAQWPYPGSSRPLAAALSLTSGTAADGTWTVTIPTDACRPVWAINIVDYDQSGDIVVATAPLSVLTVSDLPDTTPPDSFEPYYEPVPVLTGKPVLPWNVGTTTAAPGTGIEFWSQLHDNPACGQIASGTKSVTITAAPQSNPAATVTAQLHLAIDLTNPSAFGLHWAGTLKLPGNAAPGPWTASATATDYAGNIQHVGVLGNLVVSP